MSPKSGRSLLSLPLSLYRETDDDDGTMRASTPGLRASPATAALRRDQKKSGSSGRATTRKQKDARDRNGKTKRRSRNLASKRDKRDRRNAGRRTGNAVDETLRRASSLTREARRATTDSVKAASSAVMDRVGRGRGRAQGGFTLSAHQPGSFLPSSEIARAKLGSRTLEAVVLCTIGVVLVASRFLGRGKGLGMGRGRGSVRGTWVKDRSLGGKMIFVPATSQASQDRSDFPLPATSASASSSPTAATRAPLPQSEKEKKPSWWRYDDFSGRVREGARPQIRHLVKLLESAKEVYGRDVNLNDLVELKRLCEANAITVAVKTTSGRDSMFRTAVEGCLDAIEGGRATVAGENAGDILNGLAVGIAVPKERALSISSGETAARLRALLLQSLVSLRTNEDLELAALLIRIDAVLAAFPFERDAPEVEVITRSLRNRVKAAEARKILASFPQESEGNVDLVREMLGLPSKITGV